MLRQPNQPTLDACAALLRPYWPEANPDHLLAALRRGLAPAAPGEAPSGERLLSVKQAAARLGLSERSVWRYVYAGRLPSRRVGVGARRIREADVLAMIQELPAPTAAEPPVAA